MVKNKFIHFLLGVVLGVDAVLAKASDSFFGGGGGGGGTIVIAIEQYLLFSDKDISLKRPAPLTCKGGYLHLSTSSE